MPTVKIIPPRPLTFLRIRFAKPPLFKSFLNCSQIPQPTLRRLLKTGRNLSKSIAMYLLNLIYKQPLTTSVMRGGGWMTAIINLAIIFTFIDQQ